MTLQLEVGKTYIKRSGDIVKISLQYDTPTSTGYEFECERGETYKANGCYFSDEREASMDLIDEVILGADLNKEGSEKSVEGLILVIGKKYNCRDGSQVTLKAAEFPSSFYPFYSDKGYLYTAEGRFYLEQESDKDIVSEVVTEENQEEVEENLVSAFPELEEDFEEAEAKESITSAKVVEEGDVLPHLEKAYYLSPGSVLDTIINELNKLQTKQHKLSIIAALNAFYTIGEE